MARKTGVPSLLNVSKKMCRLIAKYQTVIVTLYPTNTALLAALAAALAACAELQTQLAAVREWGD